MHMLAGSVVAAAYQGKGLLRARLVATSNYHFDPDYRDSPQNFIFALSGISIVRIIQSVH